MLSPPRPRAIHAAALVGVEVGLIEAHQAQVEAELLGLLQFGQPPWLLVPGVAHQLVDQQKRRGPRQLFTDLLHFTGQQQPLLVVQQAVNPGGMGASLLHHNLATLEAVARPAIERHLGHGLNLQGDAKQPPPHRHRPPPLDIHHGREVVCHQTEGALGQALAVLIGAHLVEQLQCADTEQRHQHQHGEHAAVDAQEDRVHGREVIAALQPLRRQTDSLCCAQS